MPFTHLYTPADLTQPHTTIPVLEYKFVIKDTPHRVVRWEEGKNHSIILSDVIGGQANGVGMYGSSGDGLMDRVTVDTTRNVLSV